MAARWVHPVTQGFSEERFARTLDAALVALLIVDGFIVGLLSVFLTYVRIGDAVAPIGIAIALVGNTALVWLASRFTESSWRWGPLLAWMVVLLAAGFTGPGGDVVLVTDWRAIVLLLAGVAGPAVLGWRGALAR